MVDMVEVDLIINNALREDVGGGDHTSLSCILHDARGKARLLVKDTGILAGVEFAKRVFSTVDPELRVEEVLKDGAPIKHGDVAFYVSGRSLSILRAERLVLNTMQRMSAIATKTRRFVDLLSGTKTKVLDTRKTTPGFRALEKWAVKIGGGVNHRFGLYDVVMIKDNHIDFAGGIYKAIEKTQEYMHKNKLDLKIIVEARDIAEVESILQCRGVHRILLDNFDFLMTRQAVQLIDGRVATESSGGIDEGTARGYADCGVDFVSCGALTHSVYNLDLSLKAC